MGRFEDRVGAQRPAQVDALGRGQQFDGDDVAGVRVHLGQPPRGEGRHADMVLLVGRGRQAVDTGRVGQRLVLAGERSGGDLGDHEARIEARILDQEGGQLTEAGIDQKRHAALGQGADLGDGEGQIIGRHRHRLGMEVAR